MNWVGGARNRLKQNPERKFQRQSFNPRRINGRPLNKPFSPPKVSYRPRPPPIKQPVSRDAVGLSQDLIGLHTLNSVHDLDNTGQTTQYRHATRVHMDSARKHPINSSYDIELPMSPSTVPSALQLLDVTGDDMSLYGDHQPRVSTMKPTNQNAARQFDPPIGSIGMGYGNECDVSFGTDERSLSESVISSLPVAAKRHHPSWSELNNTSTESIFPTSKGPSKLFQSFQNTRFKPPSRNGPRTSNINRAPEYGNPSKRSKTGDNSIYRNSALDTDSVLPVTNHSHNIDSKGSYRDWYTSKGGGGSGQSSRSSDIHKPDPFKCDSVSTNRIDRETPSSSSRSLDVQTLTTFHQMQKKPVNITGHTHSTNATDHTHSNSNTGHTHSPNPYDSFSSHTDTIVSRGSTYEERPVLLNLNRPNKVQNSSVRLVSKISTVLEPLETTPTISVNKPHPFSVPDNTNTGTIRALSAFEKMIQSLENEDPTPPTSLQSAPPTLLPPAPPTLPPITVASGSTKKQDMKWMEFIQGKSGGENEIIHVSTDVNQIKVPPPQAIHKVSLACGGVNDDCSIVDNDIVLDEDIDIAEDPEIVLSDEDIFTSADPFESFYHNHSIRKGRELIKKCSDSIISREGIVPNIREANTSSTEPHVSPLAIAETHDAEPDLGESIDQPLERIKLDTPIKAPPVTTPTTDTSYTQTDHIANNSTGTQTEFDVQNNVTLLDATTCTGEDQVTAATLHSVTTQTDIPNDIKDPISHDIDCEARADINNTGNPSKDRLLQAFKLNSDRIFSVLSTCREGDSIIHDVQNDWIENERLFKELTNDLVYQSLLSKLDQ